MAQRFSSRNGSAKPPRALQVDGLDASTRNALWNAVDEAVHLSVAGLDAPLVTPGLAGSLISLAPLLEYTSDRRKLPLFQRKLWVDHWDVRSAVVANRSVGELTAELEQVFVDGTIGEIFDVVEILVEVQMEVRARSVDELIQAIESVLARKHVGFRLTQGLMLPVTGDLERAALVRGLEDASRLSGNGPLSELERAHGALRRQDWVEAARAAFNAVEGAARTILGGGRSKDELPKALKALQADGRMHPALAKGWAAFYGYASETGIRHGGVDEGAVDRELAIYFVVSSSAFVTLLVSHAESVSD